MMKKGQRKTRKFVGSHCIKLHHAVSFDEIRIYSFSSSYGSSAPREVLWATLGDAMCADIHFKNWEAK
jgi:hypothetical protein